MRSVASILVVVCLALLGVLVRGDVTVSICRNTAGNCDSGCTKYKVKSDQCLVPSNMNINHTFNQGTSMFKCLPPTSWGSISGIQFGGKKCSTTDYPSKFRDQRLGSSNFGTYYNLVKNTNGTTSVQAWQCSFGYTGNTNSTPYTPPPAAGNCTLQGEGPVDTCVVGIPNEIFGTTSYIFDEPVMYVNVTRVAVHQAMRNNYSCPTPLCDNCTKFEFNPTHVIEDKCMQNSYEHPKHGSHFKLSCDTTGADYERLPSLNKASSEDLAAFSAFVAEQTPKAQSKKN